MPHTLDLILALVDLRWTLWRRRLWREGAIARVLLQSLGILGGAALSLTLAVRVVREASRLSRHPVEVLDAGGPLAVAAAWLSLGFLIRLYFAILAAGRGTLFLDPRRFLVYAVPPRLVTTINVFAQLAEPAWLFFYPPALAVAIGVARIPGAPSVAALACAIAVLILVTAAVFHLAQAVLAEIAARAWTRRFFLIVLLSGGYSLASRPDLQALIPDGASAWALLSRFPPGWAASLAQALTAHEPLHALLELARLLALGLIAAALAHRLSLREARRAPEVVRAAAGSPRGRAGWAIPLLSDPVSALIEKELKTLLRAGWLQLLIAPLGFAFLRLAVAPGRPLFGAHPLLVAGGYAHLGVLGYSLNLFGWDCDGARGYFLWPVRGRAVLAAKNAVAWFMSLLLFCAMTAFIASLGGLGAREIALGLLAHTATFPFLAALGNAGSILFPTPLRGARLRRNVGASGLVRLVALALVALAAWAPVGLSALTGRPLEALYLGELIAMALVFGGMLAASETLLEHRRESLLHALARDE